GDRPPAQSCALSLHDALPISANRFQGGVFVLQHHVQMTGGGTLEAGYLALDADAFKPAFQRALDGLRKLADRQFPGIMAGGGQRSEEHTSELQSRENLVCRLL